MTKSVWLGAIAILLSVGVPSGAAYGHHSAAMFDPDKLLVLRGTLLSFSFMNPHAWLSVTVPDGQDAPAGRWDIEATSTLSLTVIGIQRDTLKPGDKLTVGIRPLRDGRRGGSFVFIVDGAGKTYGVIPEKLGLKTDELTPH